MRKIKEIISHGRRLSSRLQEIDGRTLESTQEALRSLPTLRVCRRYYREPIRRSIFLFIVRVTELLLQKRTVSFFLPGRQLPRIGPRAISIAVAAVIAIWHAKSYVGIAICLHVH